MVGSIDPNPIVAGKGLRILEENGVEVVYDVMRAECDAINRHFLPLHHHRNGGADVFWTVMRPVQGFSCIASGFASPVIS